jgi:lactobin A/cerein 7B family class IIb bacteriocin
MSRKQKMEIEMSNELSNLDEGLQIRALGDTELEQVNGGIIPILLAALAFEVGLVGGAVAANYYYTGTFFDDYDL